MHTIVSIVIGLAAIIFALNLVYRRKGSSDVGDLTVKWIITAACVFTWVYLGANVGKGGIELFLFAPIAIVSGILLSVIWTPHIASLISSPFTKWYDGG